MHKILEEEEEEEDKQEDRFIPEKPFSHNLGHGAIKIYCRFILKITLCSIISVS